MRPLDVDALTQQVDRLIQRSFPVVLVEGEISQLHTPASGHCYFVLRGRRAQLGCVMWRNDWRASTFRPEPGQRVLARGRLGVYPEQGKYQLYANVLRPAGEGELQRRLEAIKARLQADGLLDERRKRPLPTHPRVVGVATSLTGAALQDFLRVSRQRWPAARIVVAGCTVQGQEAAGSVIRALELLFDHGRAEVVVVTRGGGSKLDLLPFMDETLARWIATAPVPVISAVGHEIDTTIADLVADAVAPTPSAAAMLALPDGPALTQRVDEAAEALQACLRRQLVRSRRRLDDLRRRLQHPGRRVALQRQRCEELSDRLHVAAVRQIDRRRTRLAVLAERLEDLAQARVARQRYRLEALEGRLRALSPYAVLERGYAIVSGDGGVVTDPATVRPGDPLSVRVARGRIDVTVRQTPTNEDPKAVS